MKLTPSRLSRSVTAGFQKRRRLRKFRSKMLSEMVTRFYDANFEGAGSDDDRRIRPVNLMGQAVMTIIPNLVFNNPKVQINPKFILDYKPYARRLELATNHAINEIKLRDELRMAVTDGVFGSGWIKTGLAASDQTIDIGNDILIDPGQPYARRVSPDDMTIDVTAASLNETVFIGDRIRVQKDALKQQGVIDPDKVDQLRTIYESNDFDEASRLSQTSETINHIIGQQGVVEWVELVEVYLPFDNIVVVMPFSSDGSSQFTDFLHRFEYDGPETGPYHQLGFAKVPDNIEPAAPAAMWYDLHMLANRMMRKIARQADRQKTVLAYESSAWEDAQDVVDSVDGESVRVDNVDAIKELSYGGTVDGAYDYVSFAKQLFSEQAMNVDLLSGSGTNEPTATQAEIVHANTSVRLADMQNIVYQFAADVCKDLVYWLHTDPLIDLPLISREDGRDVQVRYTAEDREGDWLDYNVDIVAYSMARQDPNTKLRRLMEFWGNVIPALANARAILGPSFRLENAMEMASREMGIERLSELIDMQSINEQDEQMREIVRRSIPLSPKIIRHIMNPIGGDTSGNQGANTPNPSGMMQSGITPSTERAQSQQETAADLQSNSSNALARAMNGMFGAA